MTITLLSIAVVLYTLLILFASRASGKIDSYWSSTIFGVASTVTPLALWLLGRATGKATIATTPTGIGWSVAAGAVAGVFTALLVKIMERGAVSYATPAIYGGALALASITGWLFLKEAVSAAQAAGIALIIIGVSLIVYAKLNGAAA